MSKVTGRCISRSSLFLGLQFVVIIFLSTQVFGSYRIPASAVTLWPSLQAAPGKQVFQTCITAGDTQWAYFIYLPTTYDSNGTKKWPMLIFQEVASALYNDGWNNQNPSCMFDSNRAGLNGGPVYDLASVPPNAPYLADRFIVLAPYVSAGMINWKSGGTPGRLLGLYKNIIQRYKVDTTHISMMGDCAGAAVVWMFSATYPKFPSALALFNFYDTWSSTVDLTLSCNLKDIAYRHYVDTLDTYSDWVAQKDIYNRIVTCGGTKMTLITQGKGQHEIWGLSGLDTVKAMYDWMLANSTGGSTAISESHQIRTAPISKSNWSAQDIVEIVGLNGQVLMRMQGDAVKTNTIARTMPRGVQVVQVKHADNSIDRMLMPR